MPLPRSGLWLGSQVRPKGKSCDSLMCLGPGDGAVRGTGSSAAQTDRTQSDAGAMTTCHVPFLLVDANFLKQ